MLKEAEGVSGVIDLMISTGALLNGHFELASGLHSAIYIQCAKLLEHPVDASTIGTKLAGLLKDSVAPRKPQVVLSPALGGVIIGHEVARSLGCRHIFAERIGGKMILRRGFEIKPGEGVIIVEDVITTGSSADEVLQIARTAGASTFALGMIVNRSHGLRYDMPIVYLVKGDIPTYEPDRCPLCEQGLPLEKPGTKRSQIGGVD